VIQSLRFKPQSVIKIHKLGAVSLLDQLFFPSFDRAFSVQLHQSCKDVRV
jgi:hypothetical protein